MGNDYLGELLENTKQIIKPTVDFDIEEFVINGEPSPSFIYYISTFATHLEDQLKLKNLECYKGDAKACYDTYHQKKTNPMGFHLMLSKLLPALGCPHTILTTGPVKRRLDSKRAKLLLLNFLASINILLANVIYEYIQYTICTYCCDICNSKIDSHAALIAHISGPDHMKKVVEKWKKENNIKSLQYFGYDVYRTQTSATTSTKKSTKINQLREGLRNISTNIQEQLGRQYLSSNRKAQTFRGASVLKVDVVDEDSRSRDFKASEIDVGPGNVTERSQECGSTPPAIPASSITQEDATESTDDGAATVTGAGQGGSSRICWSCHARRRLLKCSGCRRAWYCDVRCQGADWARHGGYCEARMRKRRLQEVD